MTEKDMCSVLKNANPDLVEISKVQHAETMSRMENLTKAIYIASGVVTAIGVLLTGSVFFAISALISK